MTTKLEHKPPQDGAADRGELLIVYYFTFPLLR